MSRVLAILLLCCSPATASAADRALPVVAVGNSAGGAGNHGWLDKPSGAGPFPAIVLAHTCGGVSPHTDVWGKLW